MIGPDFAKVTENNSNDAFESSDQFLYAGYQTRGSVYYNVLLFVAKWLPQTSIW